MKELNSNLYGLSELTENEKRDTEGGLWVSHLIVGAASWAIGIVAEFAVVMPMRFFTSFGIGAW